MERHSGPKPALGRPKRLKTEMEAKNFARAKFDEGLVVTAGTIIPHLPRRSIASGSITAWLDEGREQDSGHAAESTDPQSRKIE